MNKIISNKNGIIFSKNNYDEYISEISIQNNNINLKNICNLDTFNYFLLFKQNFCDIIEFKKINNEEGTLLFLFKHFFEDLGFPHYYFYKKITYEKLNNNDIIFHLNNVNSNFPDNLPSDIEEFEIEKIDIILTFKDENNIICKIIAKINNFIEIHGFLEKIIEVIMNKIIIILKYILENYHILNN
jgi:hypothetical protein